VAYATQKFTHQELRIAQLEAALTDVLKIVDGLTAESGRLIEYDEEDAFRRGEWFDSTEIFNIENARAALKAKP
jgi:hypothetical protein